MSVYGKKTQNPGWISGGHWNECQRCGFAVRSFDLRQEWNGLRVCSDCWEARNAQDFVKGVKDNIAPHGLNQPETEEDFKTTTPSADGPNDTIPSGNNFGNEVL